MKFWIWRLLPCIFFIILIVFFARALFLDPKHLSSSLLGKPLPMFEVLDLETPSTYLSSSELQGQMTLLNVWASWCESCIEEHVFLLRLAKKGVVIYGLNYKDHPLDAQKWLSEWGNPYRRVGIDKAGKTAIDLGVYGVPETFLIDAKGIVRYRHVGLLNTKVWEKFFLPKMKERQHG